MVSYMYGKVLYSSLFVLDVLLASDFLCVFLHACCCLDKKLIELRGVLFWVDNLGTRLKREV